MPSPSPPTTIHSIPLPPLTKFLQTLSSPASLARLLSILSQHRTPNSWDSFDERALGSGEIWGDFEGEVDEGVMRDMCGPPEKVEGEGQGQGGGGERVDTEGGLAEPPKRVLQEVRVDLRTLAPSAIFALESWRRELLGMEALVLESREYNPSAAQVGESSHSAGGRNGGGGDVYGTALAMLQERDFGVEVGGQPMGEQPMGQQPMGEQLSPDTPVAMDLVEEDEEKNMDMDVDEEEVEDRPFANQASPTRPTPAVEPPSLISPATQPAHPRSQNPVALQPQSSQIVEEALPGLGLGLVSYSSPPASAHGDDEDEGLAGERPPGERQEDDAPTSLALPLSDNEAPQLPTQSHPLPEPASSSAPSLNAPIPLAGPSDLPERDVSSTDEAAEAEMLDMVDFGSVGEAAATVEERRESVAEAELEVQSLLEEPLGAGQALVADEAVDNPEEAAPLSKDQTTTSERRDESEAAPVSPILPVPPDVVPIDALMSETVSVRKVVYSEENSLDRMRREEGAGRTSEDEPTDERTSIDQTLVEPPVEAPENATNADSRQPQPAGDTPKAPHQDGLSSPEPRGRIVWSGVFTRQSAVPESAVIESERRRSAAEVPRVERSEAELQTAQSPPVAITITSEATTVEETTIQAAEVSLETIREIQAAPEAPSLAQRQLTPEPDPGLASRAVPTVPASSQVFASPVRGEDHAPASSSPPAKEATAGEASASEIQGNVTLGEQQPDQPAAPMDSEPVAPTTQHQSPAEGRVSLPLPVEPSAVPAPPPSNAEATGEDGALDIDKSHLVLPAPLEGEHEVAVEATTDLAGEVPEGHATQNTVEPGQGAHAADTALDQQVQSTPSASQAAHGEASEPTASPSAPRTRNRKSDRTEPFLTPRRAQASVDQEEHELNDGPLEGKSALEEVERDVEELLDEEETEEVTERVMTPLVVPAETAQEGGLPATLAESLTAVRKVSSTLSQPPSPAKQQTPPPEHSEPYVSAPSPSPSVMRSDILDSVLSPPLKRKKMVVNTYRTLGKKKSNDTLSKKAGKRVATGPSNSQSTSEPKPSKTRGPARKTAAQPVEKRKRGRPSAAMLAERAAAQSARQVSAAASKRPHEDARQSSSKAAPRRQFKAFEIVLPKIIRGPAKRREVGEDVSESSGEAARLPETGSSSAASSHPTQALQLVSNSPKSSLPTSQPRQPTPAATPQSPPPRQKRARASRGEAVVGRAPSKRKRTSLEGKGRAVPEVEIPRRDPLDSQPSTPVRQNHLSLQAAEPPAPNRHPSFSIIDEAMERLDNPLHDLESVSLQGGYFSPTLARAARISTEGASARARGGGAKDNPQSTATLWSEEGSADGNEEAATASPSGQPVPPLPPSPPSLSIPASQSPTPATASLPPKSTRRKLISAPFRSRASSGSRPGSRQRNPPRPSALALPAPAPVSEPVPVAEPVPELVAQPPQPAQTTSAPIQSAATGFLGLDFAPTLRALNVNVDSGVARDGSAGPAADPEPIANTMRAGKKDPPRRERVVFDGIVLPMRVRTRKSLNTERRSSLRVKGGARTKVVPRKSI
ncbi:hypothetical protein IAR50_006904 [Cryptococcus sp. DSM 104548]